jgi:phage shock protein PspC (stress-responsive transcriptional regulator)
MAFADSVVARDDTLLGSCHALGEDFGFNPFYLRLLVAGVLFYSPVAALAIYTGLTALVTLSRWIAPNPLSLPEAAPKEHAAAPEADHDLPLAA